MSKSFTYFTDLFINNSKENYSLDIYKKYAISTAKDFLYGHEVIKAIELAQTENEIIHILSTARERLA